MRVSLTESVFRVGELAKKTGLSVRALRHYDQIGLLSPRRRTEAGYRLYSESDVARLQQIVSLRQLGLSLGEIRACLDQPGCSPGRVLELHITILSEEIEAKLRLREHLSALAQALDAKGEPTVEELLSAIEEMTRMDKYYTPEQREEIRRRGEALGEERLRAAEAEWLELIAKVGAAMDAGTDPADEKVQQLARRYMELVHEFTGGNPGIEQGVRNMWQQEETIHGIETARVREMMEYVGKSLRANQ